MNVTFPPNRVSPLGSICNVNTCNPSIVNVANIQLLWRLVLTKLTKRFVTINYSTAELLASNGPRAFYQMELVANWRKKLLYFHFQGHATNLTTVFNRDKKPPIVVLTFDPITFILVTAHFSYNTIIPLIHFPKMISTKKGWFDEHRDLIVFSVGVVCNMTNRSNFSCFSEEERIRFCILVGDTREPNSVEEIRMSTRLITPT